MTNPAVVGSPLTVADVLQLLDRLREQGRHRFLADPTSLSRARIDLAALAGPKQVTDFHLVNLAATSDAVPTTFDRRLIDVVAPPDRGFVELIPA
jgi:hypothetical protein